MFLQAAVPSNDSRWLGFFWQENSAQKSDVYEYSRHVFGAQSMPICANYALHQAAKENAKDEENHLKPVKRNFSMDDFLKSVRKPQDAIEIYQKVREILSKSGINLTNWITSDEGVEVSHSLPWNWARSSSKNNSKNCPILCLSRVWPIRHTTILKLELQAAVYEDCFRRQILREHDVKIDKIYHWTDSSTVLQWLQSTHKKQQVFVANNAREILENSSMDQWKHVKGIKNPADNGTRAMFIEGFTESGWLNGPAWLQTDEKSGQSRGAKWTKLKLSMLPVLYPENDLINTCSHLPIPVSTTLDQSKSNFEVPWSDGAASSLV